MSVTLQIELPEKDAALLLDEANRQGVTLSELLPRLLRRNGDAKPVSLTAEQHSADPIWSIVGLARTGTTDASTNHDRYIYDEDR